ncbi:ABC transporter ATP-binding protein [Bacillus carboniphilus]|uniref:ABC transporter ATP-binding protein n=1 Tax=Bacillus carboniphilus TaxID=86663 RepID=A0ABN0VUY4_9BACI
MSFLELKDVSYGYDSNEQVVEGMNWKLEKGQFYSLLGKSGCGKTTLLKLASGLLQPKQGSVFLDQKKILKPSPKIGYVFQSPTLLEWKTVMDNILLPLSLRRKIRKEDREYAEELLHLMGGLSHFADKYPLDLSGGQQSRVAIARALIHHPSMLFLDEPFAALDAITKEELQDDLLKLCQKENKTVLFITHDIHEAVYLSDYVTVMDKGNILAEFEINLEKPRKNEVRYDSRFIEYTLQVRKAISGRASNE